MSETKLTYNTVESLPVLEEVPENATLLAVVDGEFYHVPSGSYAKKKLDIVITVIPPEGDGDPTFNSNVSYADILAALNSGNIGTAVFTGQTDSGVIRYGCPNFESGVFDDGEGTTSNAIWIWGNDVGVMYLEDGRILMD